MAVLAQFPRRYLVRRTDVHTLELECARGMLRYPFEAFLFDGRAIPAGWTRALPDYDVEVAAVDGAGHPLRMRFRFREPLESPRYLWFCLKEDRVEPFALPAVGQVVAVSATRPRPDARRQDSDSAVPRRAVR